MTQEVAQLGIAIIEAPRSRRRPKVSNENEIFSLKLTGRSGKKCRKLPREIRSADPRPKTNFGAFWVRQTHL